MRLSWLSGRLPGLLRASLACGALILSSCGGGSTPMGPPTLTIDMPTPGQTLVAAGGYEIDVTVTNFTWQNPFQGSPPSIPTAGHYHVYLDSDLTDYIAVGYADKSMFTLPGTVTSGAHTLTINLRESDHTEIQPPVQATVSIMVQ